MTSLVYTVICNFPDLMIAIGLSMLLGIGITIAIEFVERCINKGGGNESR